MALRDRIASLLGVSTYTAPARGATTLDDIEKIREIMGGQLSPLPQSQTRWFLADLERAIKLADTGDLSKAAQLYRSMRRDATFAGLLATGTDGLVRLPRKFDGKDEIVKALQGRDGVRPVFDAMCPPNEIAMLEADGRVLGVGVGELCPVEGRRYPVFVRHDPQWLRFRWSENRWYYQTIGGSVPITPGDGRWILHLRGGRVSPWQNGLWAALGRSWINKEHAALHQANWEAKLANPARAAIAPLGADETQRNGFLQALIAWGINTVFELPVGWDVKLIESNGRGWEAFDETIQRSNKEFMIALAGQEVTVTGGSGFANAGIHASIRSDLIKASADALAHTINTQILPSYVIEHFGEDALDEAPVLSWDTKPPSDRTAEASAAGQLGTALKLLNEAIGIYGMRVDARAMMVANSIPTQDVEGDTAKDSGGDTKIDPVVDQEREAA